MIQHITIIIIYCILCKFTDAEDNRN